MLARAFLESKASSASNHLSSLPAPAHQQFPPYLYEEFQSHYLNTIIINHSPMVKYWRIYWLECMCAQQEMCHERNRKLSEEGESKKEEMIKLWQNVDGYKSFLLVTLDRHVVVECIKWLCCEKELFTFTTSRNSDEEICRWIIWKILFARDRPLI